jgi:hypothetical protein
MAVGNPFLQAHTKEYGMKPIVDPGARSIWAQGAMREGNEPCLDSLIEFGKYFNDQILRINDSSGGSNRM